MITTPHVLSSILIKQEDNQTYALDIDSGEVFALNNTAAKILAGCQQGLSVLQIAAGLISDLSEPTPEALVLQDVEETLQELIQLGICGS